MPTSKPVGWNWTISRSRNTAPARAANDRPCPREDSGFVVCWNNPPTPPVASTTMSESSSTRPSARSTTTPLTRPFWVSSSTAGE